MPGLTKPSKTICPYCFSDNVRRQAWINPNTHQFDEYLKGSLENGQCMNCGNNAGLIPVGANIRTIDNKFEGYLKRHNEEPRYVRCLVMYTDDRNYEEHVTIKLSSDFDEEKDNEVFYSCDGVPALKALCDKGAEDFIIIKTYCFDNRIS